jgi:hypothetical protein
MAEKNNAKCSICGNDYHMCLSCKDAMSAHPWKIHCCTSEHYKVFQIIRGLSTGVYTKDEVREKLQNVNLEDLNTFRPHIKKIIKDILKDRKETIAESINENIEVESTIIEKEIPVVEKTTFPRKRNYKVETE